MWWQVVLKSRKDTFDDVAALYDEARPRYLEQLFDDMAQIAGLRNGSRVLEIGPGPGIATLPLAARGYEVTAVERAPKMAARCADKLKQFPNVRVEVGEFESWNRAQNFDAIVSGTAFHWIDEATRCRKAAELLAPGGYIALFRHNHVVGGDQEFFDRSQRCYQQFIPGTDPNFKLPEAKTHEPRHVEELKECGFFESPVVKTYLTEHVYTSAEFTALMTTTSDKQMLEPDARDAFLKCIADLIDREFVGSIRKCYLTELVMAQKKPG